MNKNLLRQPLSEIKEGHISQVVCELCQIVSWPVQDFHEHKLFEFLQQAMTTDPKKLSTACLAHPSVLDKKMEKIQDHGFYPVCKELVELKGNGSLELSDRITLMTFLKKYFASHRPESAKKHSILRR